MNFSDQQVVEQYANDEQSIIGIVLSDPEKLYDIPELKPEHFYMQPYREIFNKILDFFKEDAESITLSNIAPYAVEAGVSISDLSEWMGSAFPSETKRTAGRIIRYSKAREAADLAGKLLSIRNTTNPETIDNAIQEATATLTSISESGMEEDEGDDIADVLAEVNEHVEEMHYNKNKLLGLGTGLKRLDLMTSGFQGGQLIVIAARPSIGKSAFALSVTKAIGLDQKTPIAFYPLEMKKRAVGLRLVSNIANIDGMRLRQGRLEPDEWERYTMALSELSESKIKIKDKSSVSTSIIRAQCRKMKREWGLSAVVIDHLQLLTPDRSNPNRVQEISQMTRELKLLADELDIPVILVSQLSRDVEKRENKRPMLSDLRESGSIEQDADVVIFLYRDDYYNPDSDQKNILEVIVAKQREGMVGTAPTIYLRNYNKILDLETNR